MAPPPPPPPPPYNRPSAVRDFPSSPPHFNYPPNTAAQWLSAYQNFVSSATHPNYPVNTVAQRPSASRDFPPLCGIPHAGLSLEFASSQQSNGGESDGDGDLMPFERDDDEYLMSDDTDVEDAMSASESDEDMGGGDIFRDGDDLSFDEYLHSDALPEDVVARFMQRMSCEEVAAGGGGDTGICVVCQDDLCGEDRMDVGVIGCRHRFHADCIGKWLQMKHFCPLCKADALESDFL